MLRNGKEHEPFNNLKRLTNALRKFCPICESFVDLSICNLIGRWLSKVILTYSYLVAWFIGMPFRETSQDNFLLLSHFCRRERVQFYLSSNSILYYCSQTIHCASWFRISINIGCWFVRKVYHYIIYVHRSFAFTQYQVNAIDQYHEQKWPMKLSLRYPICYRFSCDDNWS